MASTAAAIDQAANPKSVDESLWWDSFSLLLTDLENAPLSAEVPASLVKKLKNNHAWFLGSVSLFKPPNQTSRAALDSAQINVGSHRFIMQPELKDVALHASSYLGLDEVQSYILVKRVVHRDNIAADIKSSEFLYLILLQYYIERQCLFKCIRQILVHALYVGSGSKEGDSVREEALQLFSDGLERKLLSVLQDLLSSKYPEHMEVDLATLWAEETLIEDNLVLDILFLAYYESFCTCNGEQWRSLCSLYKGILSGSFNFGKLAISVEARNSLYHAKVQLLLILVETLDLENLLQMVHDEVPFRQGCPLFSLMDVQDMDALVSSFNCFETVEAGPLILAWAVFLCLISSLPEKQDNNILTDIDHVGYVRQAFEAAPLNYFLEILQSDNLMDSDGPVTGYRSVLRTFISAFIASYEIALQDDTLKLLLNILCKIYCGEESLCVQFWDRDSFVDGPIRSLLCTLEGEFPYRTVELVRFLSALCEGSWPAECVYSFLVKSIGISSLFEIPGDFSIENLSQIIETDQLLHVPGVDGLLIPSRTRGHVLKVIDGSTVVVRWEYTQSGMLVLLLRLARAFFSNSYEEVLVTLDLLRRLVSFNTAVCFDLMDLENSSPVRAACMDGHIQESMRIDVVGIICTLVRNLSPNVISARVMSMSFSIMAKMFKCLPSRVGAVVLNANIFDMSVKANNFDVNSYRSSSGMWLLSGGLARMLLIDCEQNEDCCPMTISVLDFTMQLVESGADSDFVSGLVIFSLQYILVNHEHWKYKSKHVRWKVTLKVLEVMKKCLIAIPCLKKLGTVIRDILLCDSSIHNTLCRIFCVTTQSLERLYINRLYELKVIEGIQLAVSSALDVVFTMLVDLSKDTMSGLPVFHQALLSSTTKPVPVVTALVSLISFFRNPAIQVGAARVLSMLCVMADDGHQNLSGNVYLLPDDMQIAGLRFSIYAILCEEIPRNEDLFVAIIKLLTSAANYQPAFLVSIIATEEDKEVRLSNSGDVKEQTVESSFGSLASKKASPLDALLQYVKRSEELIESHPHLLLQVLNFLKALWQGATQYVEILQLLRTSDMFWKLLSSSVSQFSTAESSSLENIAGAEALSLAYKYECQSAVLEIMSYEMFLQKKLQEAELPVNRTSEPSKEKSEKTVRIEKTKASNVPALKDILSTWCGSSVMSNLIKSYVSCGFNGEIFLRAKIAASLFAVHVMGKLITGDSGSVSMSLTEKIRNLSKKMCDQPAFSELLAQYSLRGYSEGKESTTLILSDLYYHLEGELEGRKINPGPFRELSLYLIESKLFQTNEQKYKWNFSLSARDICFFDPEQLRLDMGLEIWDYSEWKASKPIAEKMLLCMQDANSMIFLARSKLSALKALTTMLSVCEENFAEKPIGGISVRLLESCVCHLCQHLQRTMEFLDPALDASEDILYFLATQAELLLHLFRSLFRRISPRGDKSQLLSFCTQVLKISGTALRVLIGIRTSVSGLKTTAKLLLMLLISSVEFSYLNSNSEEKPVIESVEISTEVSIASLGLLPILCNCIETAEYCTLSLASIDLILKGFLASSTWLPVLQKHLRLQFLVQKLQEKDSLASSAIILRFFLTLARVEEGAEMLRSANFFSSLKQLFDLLLDEKPLLDIQEENRPSTSHNKDEKSQQIWGLGVAVITAMIYSLGGSSSSVDIVDSVILYFFSEKSFLVAHYLNAPDFPSDDHDKKRARSQKTHTSLTALRETEHILMLICVLAKHRNSWYKTMREMDSPLRERCIHLLAFISKGAQRLGESQSRTLPLLCPPILKEEVEYNRRSSLINCRHGWFALSPLVCASKTEVSVSSTTLPLLIKDKTTASIHSVPLTYFSATAAIQMYRIAFLVLKFLCLQAEGAAKRAEEVGYIDLEHFPELPMPEILHGLQDQAIGIVTELCTSNKSEQIQPEIKNVCFLLLQIMEKALYLELCVSRSCGIRPVLGRVEEFSRVIKMLMEAVEMHTFLKASLKSLKQITSLVYPGLIQD
ncbi:uncharacterized protein LOC122658035 isoform X2 [Telopea speciosissima]|uniref:uncharacterized protein LOC122658035 isoform X2 n=1 Tax=Telopea speciosissima TaxID=54955 RepID=UPI001CC38A34|nr:uncharacterized protein LOC122658035 isoform X2 [Telopea speciosissima]